VWEREKAESGETELVRPLAGLPYHCLCSQKFYSKMSIWWVGEQRQGLWTLLGRCVKLSNIDLEHLPGGAGGAEVDGEFCLSDGRGMGGTAIHKGYSVTDKE